MPVISFLDRTLSNLCQLKSNKALREDYFNFQSYTQQDACEGFGAQKLLSSIDSKTAPLLAHVSIMIAGLIVLASTLTLPPWKIAILSIEIIFYLLITMGCLRCIHEGPLRANYSTPHEGDRVAYIQCVTELRDEAFFKMSLFSRVNAFTITLTVFLMVSTLFLILSDRSEAEASKKMPVIESIETK